MHNFICATDQRGMGCLFGQEGSPGPGSGGPGREQHTLILGASPCRASMSVHFAVLYTNHLEERLLDQAQAQAPYNSPFWGHSYSIPQGMVSDV